MTQTLSKNTAIFLGILLVIGLFISPLTANADCSCYADDGTGQSIDSTDECTAACGSESVKSSSDDALCVCETQTFSITCETTCSNEGLSNTDPTGSSSSGGNTSATVTPTLNVDIPGISFTDPIKDGNIIEINFLGDYIQAIYTYMVGIGGLVAIIMIMIGGLQYAFAGGHGDTGKAKTRIKNAVTGLVLLMSVYMILWIFNPQLVTLNSIKLEVVQTALLDSMITESVAGCSDVKGTVNKCSVDTLTNPSTWDPTLTDMVNSIAKSEGIDPILLATHIQKETGGDLTYDSSQRGPCGEIGITQFMPTTFESIVGSDCCVKAAARTIEGRERRNALCDEGSVDDWPPDSGDIPHCNIEIGCGSCEVASESCAQYFDTPENAVTAAARLIKHNLNNSAVGGDYALSMCAYNGSGSHAAQYAQSAKGIYDGFCSSSGGTN